MKKYTVYTIHTLCEIGEVIGRRTGEQKRQKREAEQRSHFDDNPFGGIPMAQRWVGKIWVGGNPWKVLTEELLEKTVVSETVISETVVSEAVETVETGQMTAQLGDVVELSPTESDR